MYCGKYARKLSGQQLIEMAAGLLILVPLVLYLFDFATIALSNQLADKFAKAAARAAANQADAATAKTAAQAALAGAPQGGFVNSLQLDGSFGDGGINYTPIAACNPSNSGQVTVQVKLVVNMPVPLPGLPAQPGFIAQDVETVVALPP